MGKNKSMKYQIKNMLGKQTCYGRSRHEDKTPRNDYHPRGIYSVITYDNYVSQCTRFAEWAKEKYGVKKVEDCKCYINEFLTEYSEGKQPASIHTMKYAIQKLFSVSEPGFKVKFNSPRRHRGDIIKNRHSIYEVRGFDPDKYPELIDFGRATGLRRSELLKVRHNDIFLNEYGVQVYVHKGKGGKSRMVKVRPEFATRIMNYAAQNDEIIFKSIPSRLPEHVLRREYAQEMYKSLARHITELPKSERYVCRKDKKGCIYDKAAMLEVSRNLGHNRIDVIALHYL